MTARLPLWSSLLLGATLLTLSPALVSAQGAAQPRPGAQTPPATRPAGTGASSTGMPVATDYTIGPDDVLGVVFWRDADMTGDVTVRPDGNITLPLLGDIKAAGLRPAELKDAITKAASKLIEDPNVTVVVRQINSRNIFVQGGVTRPGPYPISGQMTVLQVLSVAGGLTEFANGSKILIIRNENGRQTTFKFNYNEVQDGKKMEQNIVLKPGDTVLVKQ